MYKIQALLFFDIQVILVFEHKNCLFSVFLTYLVVETRKSQIFGIWTVFRYVNDADSRNRVLLKYFKIYFVFKFLTFEYCQLSILKRCWFLTIKIYWFTSIIHRWFSTLKRFSFRQCSNDVADVFDIRKKTIFGISDYDFRHSSIDYRHSQGSGFSTIERFWLSRIADS